MKILFRFRRRLVRGTSLCVGLALILTSVTVFPWPVVSGKGSSTQEQDKQQPRNDKARKVKAESPRKGPPAASLPDLDEVRQNRDPEARAQAPIPSTMRSKRKPPETRRGRTVGGTGMTGDKVGSTRDGSGNSSDRVLLARAARKLNHAKAGTSAPPPLADDQFIQNFFYWAFLRYPNSTEQAYWNDILRTAYPQGQTAMLIAMRELGMTVFESAEYAGRNRSNHDYVYDLYKSFLMRDPDSGGWSNWESVVPTIGRENVRHAFEYSTEFANLVATLTPNGSASSNAASLVTARVDPNNQTGNQLLARDCEWGVGLLNLPGRAGLDLGLGLSYSSLAWTRSGPYLYFDEDNGSPSPGFRLGFATIQVGFDAQVGRKVYVLITSSGHRIELRQVGTSNVYEAGDSSYLQLIDNGSLLVRTTDGTQMSYVWFESEWRATQIKDRNGNCLTVNYDSHANITKITDTLGRVITFNYDGNSNPVSITQTWMGQTHTWATFGWSTHTMSLGFSGVSVVGTYQGEAMPVLTQVGLDDGSYFTFQYTGVGQVNVIRRYRSDNVQSSYTAYDYAATTTDCPRISQTRVWARNWTGVNGVPSEVVTQYSGEPSDTWRQLVAPDGTVYKEYYGSGWQKGLTTQSEVWSGGVRQKWTTMVWTQDNTGVSYQTNPRLTETNIYDASGNRRRTVIDYAQYAQYGLPNGVFEYAADGSTLLRVTYTDYNLSQAYSDRHIIGLVSAVHVSDVAWQVKRVFEYDAGGDQLQATGASATQHDAAYGTGFVSGRGNLTAIHRYDATDTGNESKKLTTRMGYDTDGSLIFTRDHLSHQSNVSYTDAFSDSVNRNTFAYPTTVTDADGFSSYLQYNYDFGVKTRAQGPPPAGQTQGVIQTITYDSAARIQQITTTNNGAYTRYVYGPDYVQSFSSVNSVADDAYAISVIDGAGHSMGTVTNHPGSSGGYSMVNVIYDQMGRAIKQSNPTEINSAWAPSGDDAGGVLYTQQTYDWKGRPLVTTNTDGWQKYASYGGCGCAGGEVVTLTDEVGRQQRVYSDVLGRTGKSEALNWDGSIYSTTSNIYNARDQVTLVRQYQGADTSGTYQDTTMSYDGYGRLLTKHVPEQQVDPNNPASTDHTTYAYNSDDTVSTVTDARGAYSSYSYNNRHLVTGITYGLLAGVPTSGWAGVTPAAAVGFTYDAAGNRTSMTDGVGSASYSYDQLSRMTSEARTFTGVGTFTLSYQYNLGGELTSLTDPFSAQVGYNYDNAGRLSGVSGAGFANVSTYASSFQYRASGAVKHLSYGNGVTADMTFNGRLQATHVGMPGVMSKDYQYSADGRLSFLTDLLNSKFDRSFSYDHVGHVATGLSGVEAHGGGPTGDRPYNQTFGYDAFGHLASRTSKNWSMNLGTLTDTYVNNRHAGWLYDAEGNLLNGYRYDAAGEMSMVSMYGTDTLPTVNGDGQQAKTVKTETILEDTFITTTFYLRSSVMGGEVVNEISEGGGKHRGFVYAGNQVLAWQQAWPDYGIDHVLWEHRDPSNSSFRTSLASGAVNTTVISDGGPAELDPTSANAGLTDPYQGGPPPNGGSLLPYPSFGGSGYQGTTYTYAGIPVPVDYFMGQVDLIFQGSFGVMEYAARISAPRLRNYEVVSRQGTRRKDFGLNKKRAEGEALEEQAPLIRNWLVLENWSLTVTLLPQKTNSQWDFGSAERQMATQAVNDALNILNTNLGCRDFFNTGKFLSSDNPEDALQEIRDRGGIVRGPGDYNGPYTAYTFPALAERSTIILYNPFFSKTVGGTTNEFGRGSLSQGQARALIILHELAHAVYRNFHTRFSMSSSQLSRKIFEKCFHSGKTPLPRGVSE